MILRHLESMLIYCKNFFYVFFHLPLLKDGIVASIFQVKTDPNQAIKEVCLLERLYYKIFANFSWN